MTVLGTIASSTRQGLAAGGYQSIASQVVTGSPTSTITFNSVPATFKHLQIRSWAFAAATNADIYVYLNNDSTSSNYQSMWFGANGTNTPAGNNSATPGLYYGLNATDAGNPWVGFMDIQDYNNTSTWKQAIVNSGASRNGSGTIYYVGGHWKSASAVTRVDVVCAGSSFAVNSVFALYGWS